MKHDLVWHTDADGAYQKCRACGRIIGQNETLGGLLKPSECPGFAPRLPQHINAPCDIRDRWTYQGDILIDVWHKGRGEV